MEEQEQCGELTRARAASSVSYRLPWRMLVESASATEPLRYPASGMRVGSFLFPQPTILESMSYIFMSQRKPE